MKLKPTILFLAFGHGLNDLVAGYFLGGIVQQTDDLLKVATGLIIYNLLAFGGQYPVALLLSRVSSPKRFLLISYSFNITAIAFFPFIPQLSIVLTGIASALYHVAGGSVCVQQNKAVNIGLFAAPGVAGLIAGGYFAYERISIDVWILVFSVLFFLLLIRLPVNYIKSIQQPKQAGSQPTRFTLDQHDIIMILLLSIISLRSVVWNVFQLIHDGNYYWLIAVAASAFVGKIAGGWIADRIGWRLYMMLSLVVATPLLTLFKKEMILFCIGIGLLQSGIPATTALLIQSMKGAVEKAIGLSFGLSIIAGALIFYTPIRTWLLSDLAIVLIVTIMFLLMNRIRKSTQTDTLPGGIKLA
jgi:MFS transporter, FSR family, fosmidomycin resistance protein